MFKVQIILHIYAICFHERNGSMINDKYLHDFCRYLVLRWRLNYIISCNKTNIIHKYCGNVIHTITILWNEQSGIRLLLYSKQINSSAQRNTRSLFNNPTYCTDNDAGNGSCTWKRKSCPKYNYMIFKLL